MTKQTDMDVANPTSEPQWETLPEYSKGSDLIQQSDIIDTLTTLNDKVVLTRDQATLEAYLWTYNTLSKLKLNSGDQVTLESFNGTITKRTELAKAISSELVSLESDYSVALETYADDIQEDFKAILKTYGQANTKLRATDADIDGTKSTKVDVNHTRIFEMFMINDVFKGKEPIEAIKTESRNLERLVAIVYRGVDRIKKDVERITEGDKLERSSRDLPDSNNLNLMFNRKVKVDQGQFEVDNRRTRIPKKSHSWGQHGMIVFSTLVFSLIGLPFLGNSLGHAFNHNKKDSEAKVSNSLSDIHKFIRHVEGLDELVEQLAEHIAEFTKLFNQLDESQHSALNRRSVPIMELTMFIMRQIIDITNGTDRLFTKLVRKHSK